MKRPLIAMGMLLSLLSCGTASTPSAVPSASPLAAGAESPRVLVAMGDSLTEGLGVEQEQSYPAQLERRLQTGGLNWRVINAGLSGETSSGARSRLQWVLKTKPDAVLLETGANDGLRGIDPKITRENISFLVDELQKRDIPVMLAGMKTLSNLGPDYTGRFEALYPQVAKEKKLPLIPFFLEGVGGVAALNQEDRIHPTEQGYTKIVDEIAPVVSAWLKELDSSPRSSASPRSTP